jgi:hypothetical protein
MMTDNDEGKMLFYPDYVRERIRTSQIIDQLHKCASGEISLTRTQLWAAETLLRKCVPDLAAAKIMSEQTHRYVVEVPPVLDRDEWQRKYGQNPSLPPPRCRTQSATSGRARCDNEIQEDV